jgi:hypothetical protein
MPRRTLALLLLITIASGIAGGTARKKTPISPEQIRNEYDLLGFLCVPLYEV